VIPPDLAALLADGDDADLLRVIAQERERNREWAEGALMELHRRHVKWLYRLCHRICAEFLADVSQTENLLNRTLWRVYQRAERFEPVLANCAGDPNRTAMAVRCWMIRQAKWLAKDVAESSAMRRQNEDGGSGLVEQIGCEDEEPPECSPEVRAAIDRLPARERHVVLAFYFFTDCESGKPVPPNENIDLYCARRWGTSPPNVRKIRSRALEMLREWIIPATSPATATR
jgi:DNA-directed RNA polymerase specialized sigma24 family protein